MKRLIYIIPVVFALLLSCQKPNERYLTDSSTIKKLIKDQGLLLKSGAEGKIYLIADKQVLIYNNQLKKRIKYNKKLYAEVDEHNHVTHLQCTGNGNECTVVKIEGKETILVPVND